MADKKIKENKVKDFEDIVVDLDVEPKKKVKKKKEWQFKPTKTKRVNLEDVVEYEPPAPGYTRCRLCGQQMKFITSTHLMRHEWTTEEYTTAFPDAPLKAESVMDILDNKNNTYFDVEGKLRYKDTNELVNSMEIIERFDMNKFEEMENDFRYLAMMKSKKILDWLDKIVNTDNKKDVENKYSPAMKMRAAELILQFGPPKAAQRKEVKNETTVKKLEIKIDASCLPKGLSHEDF